MIPKGATVKLAADVESFKRAMRRTTVVMWAVSYRVALFGAALKRGQARHGAIKHARDERRAHLKREAAR